MSPPSGLAESLRHAIQVLRTISACAALEPGLRAAAADAMVDCPAPEDFSRQLEEGEVRDEQTLLKRVRDAAGTDGPHATILRRVVAVIDWRTRQHWSPAA
jgi:hypothetical protein